MITVTEEFGCPDVTFRSWQDIKIQLLTIVFIDTLFADLKKEKKKKKERKKNQLICKKQIHVDASENYV